MLYMFLALAAPASGGSGMGGMGGGSAMQTLKYPTLAFVFALILVGYTIWDIDQLSGKRYSRVGASLSLAGVPVAGVPALAGAEPGTLASGAVASGGSAQQAETGAASVQTADAGPAPAGAVPAGTVPAGRSRLAAVAGYRRGLPDRDGGHHGLHAPHHDLGLDRHHCPFGCREDGAERAVVSYMTTCSCSRQRLRTRRPGL